MWGKAVLTFRVSMMNILPTQPHSRHGPYQYVCGTLFREMWLLWRSWNHRTCVLTLSEIFVREKERQEDKLDLMDTRTKEEKYIRPPFLRQTILFEKKWYYLFYAGMWFDKNWVIPVPSSYHLSIRFFIDRKSTKLLSSNQWHDIPAD